MPHCEALLRCGRGGGGPKRKRAAIARRPLEFMRLQAG